MKVGIMIPRVIGAPVDPAALAKRAEELGFESIWFGEHPVIPVNTNSPFPTTGSLVIPEVYAHFTDPFVPLSMVAAVTRNMKLGTGICLVPERNPLLLAKEIATLDHYSGGRFIFGIGAGWLREETEMMGGDFDHRWTQTREAVLAMKEIWTKDEAEFHGKHYDFPPVRSYPKPAQKPHPPVLLGGNARNVFKRVVAWADGWFPTRGSPEEVKAGRAILDELATAAGRDPRSIQITASGQLPERRLIERFEEAGADRLVVRLLGESTDEAVSEVERYARQLLD